MLKVDAYRNNRNIEILVREAPDEVLFSDTIPSMRYSKTIKDIIGKIRNIANDGNIYTVIVNGESFEIGRKQ